MVVRGDAAGDPGRFRHHPRRSLVALHGVDGRVRAGLASSRAGLPIASAFASPSYSARWQRASALCWAAWRARPGSLPSPMGCSGFGTSAGFGPLIADVSHWFERWRGIAVGICSAGNYLSGALWPPVISHFIAAAGWRTTHIGIGLFCLATVVPLALLLGGRGRWRTAPAAPCCTLATSACHQRRCRCCSRSQASPAVSPCRCRRCISSPIAAISATAWRAAPRCCR